MGELDGRYPHGFARQKGYGTAFHRQAVAERQFDEIDHLDSLVGLDVGRFEEMVLYFHHKDIAPVALSVLEGFVQNGGGVLAIHSATASFKEQARYFEILGGRFSGHGPVEAFDIRPASAENEVWGA